MTQDNEEPSAASAGSLAWIPVAERLPDEGVLVLAYNGRCDYGFRRDGQWIDTLYGGVLANGPTHWMPLPAPPTDGTALSTTHRERKDQERRDMDTDEPKDAAEPSPASLGSHAGIKCIAFDCFGTLFDMSGVPKEEIADYSRHVRQEMFIPYKFPDHWYRLPAHPDVAEGIRRLRKKHCCVALSNGPRDLITLAAYRNDFSFDHVIDLRNWRVYKPHRAAYMTVFAETTFKPEQTLMVTANPSFGDVEGAESIGIRAQVIRHGYPNTVIELAGMLGA